MPPRGTSLLASFFATQTDYQTEAAWQGDDVSDVKDSRNLRLMFHNINGLTTGGPEGIEMFAHNQLSLEVDIQGFSEHCLDTTKFQVVTELHTRIRSSMPRQVTLHLTSSNEGAVNRYKPGGTGLLLLGDVVGRQEPQGRGGDQMGRWSYIHLRRKHKPPLTIIAAYQVCPRPTNLIGNTAYHQQLRELHANGRTGLHPRQAFLQDLGQFIDHLHSKGHDIILGGDFNETLEDRNSGILNLINRHNLMDPFLTRFPQHQAFGTHQHGTKRIDYTFISPSLYQSLKRIGYAPFEYSTPSDHRPIVLEFEKNTLFGYQDSPMSQAANRVLKSKDRRSVTVYITKWYSEIESRNGFSLLAKLEDDTATPNVAETLDEIIGLSGDIAEQECKRRRPEFYSRQIVQQRLTVSILRRHYNSLRMGRDRSNQLKARIYRAGLDLDLPVTQSQTTQALHEAREALRQTCQKNSEVRQAELDATINEALARGNKSKAKIIQTIRKVEDRLKTFKILKRMRQSSVNPIGIDRLEIPTSWPAVEEDISTIQTLEDPKTCSSWKWVTDPEEVEHYLMLRNRLHFGQAEGTPFTCSPLREDVDWAASTDTATQILQGAYQYTSTVPNCDDLLQFCKATSEQDAIPAEITLTEFRGKILRWRESTATSPSGRHLGRYKALFAPGSMDPADEYGDAEGEGPSLSAKQERITALILALINFCIRHKYALKRWRTIINVMIFKEPGNFKIHRLRVIHIYEADFNLMLAVKWRSLMRHAETKNLLHEGQYGGRPGCEAQSLTLLEELKYDISYLTRRTLFNFDNDATSCYDRIVVPFASLINRKFGLHSQVVATHAATLQQAKFYLKTSTGVSVHYYSPTQQFPIHGTGQGSGNSPSIWLFISSTLFDIHSSKSQGARFESQDGTVRVKISMVGFVDDSTGTCNDFHPNSERPVSELLQLMAADAQLWNNLLYCTGGKLELSKCSFHILHFEFRPDGRPIASLEKHDNKIQLTDLETHMTVPITSKRAFDPHQTLGHLKSPTTQGKSALQNLVRKADRVALLISTSPITRQGAYLAYQTVYLPTVRYTLPQSYFPRKTLDQAQCKSMHKLIAKCGYNRNTARALMYAPTAYAGGGFVPWYLLQGEGQIQNFLKHWRTDTLVSKTLRIAVSWLQWQAGWHRPVLEDTTSQLNHLECRWLTSLREFLATIRGSLILDQPFVQRRERRHDIYIMQYATECGLFSARDLQILNYCRLYLHVTTVSEVFDATGTQIMPAMFHCRREEWFDPTTNVTLQRRPSDYQIRWKWQQLCRRWTAENGFITADLTLGNWVVPGNELRRRRRSYIVEFPSRRLYHWHEKSYWECQPQTFEEKIFRLLRPSDWIPNSKCTPVEIQITACGYLELKEIERPAPGGLGVRPAPVTFDQYVETLALWEKQLLRDIEWFAEPTEIIQSLETTCDDESFLLLVSDGSVRGTQMTYGWVFGTNDREVYARNSGAGAGTPTSHRAEAWGLLSGSLFVYHFIQFITGTCPDDFPLQKIKFFSDNNGLVVRVKQRQTYASSYPNAVLAPDWEVVEQIHETMASISLQEVEVEWVKGHQDDNKIDLSVEAEFNVQADKLAGEYQSVDFDGTGRDDVLLPMERCRLKIAQESIHGHYRGAIREAYTLPSYFAYIRERHSWTEAQQDMIDWPTFTSAVTLMGGSPVQLLKLLHNKLPTNAEQSKTSPHQSSRCTYCECDETFYHLLTCQNERSQRHRELLYETAQNFLQQKRVSTEFQTGYLYCLAVSLQSHPLITTDHLTPRTRDCVDDQASLGIHLFLRGFIVKKWRSILPSDSEQRDSLILPRLLTILWKCQFALWEDHVQYVNQRSAQSPTYRDTLLRLKSHVRYLHSKRNRVLAAHQDQYFYEEVEEFLASATKQQMKQYIHHYEPAIAASIKAAESQPTRTLLYYTGFQRITQSVRRAPLFRTITTRHPREHTPQNPQSQRGDNILRKHTRWKTPRGAMQSLRNYFTTA